MSPSLNFPSPQLSLSVILLVALVLLQQVALSSSSRSLYEPLSPVQSKFVDTQVDELIYSLRRSSSSLSSSSSSSSSSSPSSPSSSSSSSLSSPKPMPPSLVNIKSLSNIFPSESLYDTLFTHHSFGNNNNNGNGNDNDNSNGNHVVSLTTPLVHVHRMLLNAQLQMKNYNNPADTYTPDENVKQGHMLSKLSGADKEATLMGYATKTAYLPGGFFVLGFLALFFLNFFLCCRCCFTCIKCFPTGTGKTQQERDQSIQKRRVCTTVSFFVLVAIVLLADMLVYVGNTPLTEGVNTISSILEDMKSLLLALSTSGDNLHLKAVDLGLGLEGAKTTCSAASSQLDALGTFVSLFEKNTASLSDKLTPIIDYIDMGSSYLTMYGIKYKNYAMYALWALAILSMLVFTLFHCLHSVCGVKIAMFWGMFSYFIIILLCIPWMLFTALFADFCMAPILNIISAVPSGYARTMVFYYFSCQGESIIETFVGTAKNATYDISDTIAEMNQGFNGQSLCNSSPDPNLAIMSGALDGMGDTFGVIEKEIACPVFREIFFRLFQKAMCKEIYSGIFSIWESQLVTSFFMFLVILTASFSYQYMAYAKNKIHADVDEEGEGGGGNVEQYEFADIPEGQLVNDNDGETGVEMQNKEKGEFLDGDDDDI